MIMASDLWNFVTFCIRVGEVLFSLSFYYIRFVFAIRVSYLLFCDVLVYVIRLLDFFS